MRKREVFDRVEVLCQHCLEVAKMLVCYQRDLVTRLKPSTIWAAIKKIDSIPGRPSTDVHGGSNRDKQ